MKVNKLIIAGGGTGGHVLAGVAIAQEWIKIPGREVLFVGARGGIEEKLVPRAGFNLSVLTLGSLKGVSIFNQIKTLLLLPYALMRSVFILCTYRPKAVIGVGGYASGPLVLMARILAPFLKCKIAILEQNAAPGFTNAVLGKFSHRVFLAFPGLESYFGKSKTTLSGNPVRSEFKFLNTSTETAFTVFVFGGSQGAQGINTLVLDSFQYLKDIRLFWIHQTGELDFERVKEGHQANNVDSRVEKFIYGMPDVYQKAHLVICRAGSSTLSELATVGRAAIFIPFPYASDDHQTKNANVFKDSGAAVVLNQFNTTGEILANRIRNLYLHRELLFQMEKSVHQFSHSDAAKKVVQYFEG